MKTTTGKYTSVSLNGSITVAGPITITILSLADIDGSQRKKAHILVSHDDGIEREEDIDIVGNGVLEVTSHGKTTHLHLIGMDENSLLFYVVPGQNLVCSDFPMLGGGLSLKLNLGGNMVEARIHEGNLEIPSSAGINPFDICSAICSVAITDRAVSRAIHPQLADLNEQ